MGMSHSNNCFGYKGDKEKSQFSPRLKKTCQEKGQFPVKSKDKYMENVKHSIKLKVTFEEDLSPKDEYHNASKLRITHYEHDDIAISTTDSLEETEIDSLSDLQRSMETLYSNSTYGQRSYTRDFTFGSETSDYGSLDYKKPFSLTKSGRHQASQCSTLSSESSGYESPSIRMSGRFQRNKSNYGFTDTSEPDSSNDEIQLKKYTKLVESNNLADLTHQLQGLTAALVEKDTATSEWLHEEQISKEKYEFLNCRKHPGHKMFIPIEKFSLQNLPKSYQSQEFYNLIIALGNVCVKIKVSAVSPNRPEHWPGIETPYSWPDNEQEKKVYGTGRVEEVMQIKSQESCPCETCKTSSSPSESWWLIRLVTANHVVFDDYEAQHTSSELFYDSDSGNVGIIKGVRLDCRDETRDVCNLLCVTCDVTLAEKLEKCVDDFINAWEMAFDKYFGDIEAAKEHMVIVISHPHGYYKHVSMGHFIKTHKELNNKKKFQWSTYDTPTCTGSDGAYILNTLFFNSSDSDSEHDMK